MALLDSSRGPDFLVEARNVLTMEQFEKTFTEQKGFIVLRAEGRNTVVIDSELPGLRVHLQAERGLSALEELANPAAPFLLSSLPSDAREAVLDRLEVFAPNIRSSADFAVHARLILEFSASIDGKRLSGAKCNRFPSDESGEWSTFMKANAPELQALQTLPHVFMERRHTPLHGSTIAIFSGIGSLAQAPALEQATEVYARLVAESKTRSEEMAAALIPALAGDILAGYGNSLPDGQLALDEMPEDLRRNVEASFVGSWQSAGFGSEQEAQLAFDRLTHISVRPNITLYIANEERVTGMWLYVGQ